MMGESPKRPGSFHDKPLVVVAPDISPFSFTTETWIVPVGGNKMYSAARSRRPPPARVPSGTAPGVSAFSEVAVEQFAPWAVEADAAQQRELLGRIAQRATLGLQLGEDEGIDYVGNSVLIRHPGKRRLARPLERPRIFRGLPFRLGRSEQSSGPELTDKQR